MDILKRRKKILVSIFNRAHYGRLRSVLGAIKKHPQLEMQLMVASSAAYSSLFTNIKHSRPYSWRLALPWYIRARLASLFSFLNPAGIFKNDFLTQMVRNDGFVINSRVPLFLDGGVSETMAKSLGLGVVRIVDELARIKPDIVFVNADRFEMMAVAIAAAYLNIPIAHNEGGDVSGTIDESVRHAITKLSHIHFVSTEKSRKRVIQMGENPDFVFTVGSPAIDAIKNLDLRVPDNLLPGFDFKKPYLLALLHPVATESKENNLLTANNVIKALEDLRLPTIFVGSNSDAGSNAIREAVQGWLNQKKPDFARFVKSLAPDDFYRLLANAACSLGNSSSFIREGAYFGTPVVLVGSRQSGRERGKNVQEAGLESEKIKKAVIGQIKHGRYSPDFIFGDGKSGERIVNLLAKIELPDIQKRFFDFPR